MFGALHILAQVEADSAGETEPIVSGDVTAVDWIVAGAVLVGGFALSMVVRRVVTAVLRRGSSDDSYAEVMVGRIAQTVIVLVTLVYALGVVGVQIAPLLGALGIGGIAIALALQPTLHNLFSGVVLHAQRPLRIGEEVITGDIQGEVIDITSRAVVIRANSGEIVHIPNSTVIDNAIVNLVRNGRRRTTVVVGVAYGSDVARARQVILDATVASAGVLAHPPPRVMATELADSSVAFDVDFWHGPVEAVRRSARDAVVEQIHRELGAAGITIPFPQRTVWFGSASAIDEPTRDERDPQPGPRP